jgi:hypothetical protein
MRKAALLASLGTSIFLIACDADNRPVTAGSADALPPTERVAVQADASVNSRAATDGGMPIPGPRSCFWRYGPHSADPYINLAYPDSAVFYWAAVFSTPAGAQLTLSGDFAHARYQSFISYDERGRPIESLADYLIQPDAGSTNPYVMSSNRNAESRSYAVELFNATPGVERAVGKLNREAGSNALHAPEYGDGQQTIIYRIYLPDEGKWPDGGVALPTPNLVLEDGSVQSGQDACAMLNTDQRLQVTADAVGIPPPEYRKLISQPDKPDTRPAEIPAKWFIQLDRPSLLGIYTGDINDDARRSEGGFYPNLDNHYIRTIINRKHGKVFMVRGKMPQTPTTYHGDDYMEEGDMRYWSICSNQGFANTRVNDCLFDEEIPLDANGFYTVMISRESDRPRNAIKECGIAWLPMADDGDGMFDDDVTVVQIRQMLAAPEFEHAISLVGKQSELEAVSGPYMPRTRYMQPNQVETFFVCADPGYIES